MIPHHSCYNPCTFNPSYSDHDEQMEQALLVLLKGNGAVMLLTLADPEECDVPLTIPQLADTYIPYTKYTNKLVMREHLLHF